MMPRSEKHTLSTFVFVLFCFLGGHGCVASYVASAPPPPPPIDYHSNCESSYRRKVHNTLL